jgi:outer membrane protein OmpA-like peptidoglycan-associated protein/tetratricopeptide (TPR) repeat protein
MKNIYQNSTVALLAVILTGCAQNYYNKGNDKFESMGYSKAIFYYEKALAKKEYPNAIINLAESYRLTNNTVKAEEWYRKAVTLPISRFKYPEHKLYLAEALKENQKYDEAADWLKKYLKDVPDDKRAINLLKYCDSISVFTGESFLYSVEEISVNTKESNFSPVFFNKGIVFCSERNSGKIKNTDEWTGNSFLDLYYSEALDSGKFSRPVKLAGAINTSYHDGPATFPADGKEIYFTRTNMNKNKLGKSKDNITHLKICKARSVENKWIEAEDFPYNNKEYSVGHPSISPDGKLMYFVSNVPGGMGGTDIYVTHYENGKWSEPENPGRAVNTEGNETFPFYFSNGEKSSLFFSSDGRPGLGGLDVYCSEIKDSVLQEAIHISAPVNSSRDDFGFIMNKEYKGGYFSSNRDSTADKIYKFSINEPLFNIEVLTINGLSKKNLPDSKIILHDLTKGQITELMSDTEGKVNIKLTRETDYKIISGRENYIQDSLIISTMNKKQSETFKGNLSLMPILKVRGHVISKTTKLPLSNVSVGLLNFSSSAEPIDYSNRAEKKMNTGDNGDFEYILSPDINYHILGRKEKYFAESIDLSTMGKYDSEIFDVKLELEEIVLNKAIRLDNIYYDYNKWDIRPDAGIELDKLVNLLEKNPEIKIELSSHTDSRGGDSFNMKLSQKRAESAVRYIVSKGIRQNRVVAKGYGESQTLNRCKNNIKCTEEEYQFNRRTEFKVLKINP